MRIQVFARLIPVMSLPPFRTRPPPKVSLGEGLAGVFPRRGRRSTTDPVLTADRPGLLPFALSKYPTGAPNARPGSCEDPKNPLRSYRPTRVAPSGKRAKRSG